MHARPTLLDLFLCFQGIAIRSFGGVLPWTRRALVEERQWLDADEFSNMLGLCQFLPGPNVGNLSIVVGSRFHGVPGAIACLAGLTVIPVAIVIALGALYDHYGQLPVVRGVIDGTAAAAAGLIGGMALKMSNALLAKKAWRAFLFLALSFVGVGLLRWPLAQVMLVLAPISILAAKP